MTALVAVDLDQTVVYSRRSVGEQPGPLVVVEHLDGEPSSSMTEAAVAAWRVLAARHLVVPVTTRTVEQYRRVRLPSPVPYAVCANGGVLLVDGARDAAWDRDVARTSADATPLPEVLALLREVEREPWVRGVRPAEELFAYVVAHSRDDIPVPWLTGLTRALSPLGWGVSVQGRKVYAVPSGLSKAGAVRRLADRLGSHVVLAAGDSLLDRPLLELAVSSGGAAVRPAHGELHDIGWSGAHVTDAAGARAAEELLTWLAGQADRLTGSGGGGGGWRR